jgi:hypothetical protein
VHHESKKTQWNHPLDTRRHADRKHKAGQEEKVARAEQIRDVPTGGQRSSNQSPQNVTAEAIKPSPRSLKVQAVSPRHSESPADDDDEQDEEEV